MAKEQDQRCLNPLRKESHLHVSLVENGRTTRGAYKDSSFMKEQQFQANMKDTK